MACKQNYLPILRQFRQSAGSLRAPLVIEIDQYVVAQHRKPATNIGSRKKKGNAQTQIQLLTRTQRKKMGRAHGFNRVNHLQFALGIHAHLLPGAIGHL